MKGRLFWKIFLGFWITFVVIFEGVWLLYEVLRPVPSDLTRSLARISLAAAASAVHLGGQETLHNQIASWPVNERGRVIIRPWTKTSRLSNDIASGLVSIKATDPKGQAYWIGYNVTKFRFANHSPFDIPSEIIGIALVVGLVFSASLAWYMSKPARQMQAGFNRLSAGDFSVRLAPAMGGRKDEIADLARGFDSMAGHIQELIGARDRLLADVSHELRSPLARLQLAIDVASQDAERVQPALSRVRQEALRLDAMVDELLTLSKLESGAPGAEEYFDIAEVVNLVVEDARFEAAPKGVSIACRIAETIEADWVLRGSGMLMSRAVENVLRNAIRFSSNGQTVTLELTGHLRDILITIADQGPGVPPAQIDSLFQPFVQGMAKEDQGYGLGLSIAQRAIAAMGGTIKAMNRDPTGFVVAITLPRP